MSARRILVTGTHPHCGKTHLTAALARWLARHGYGVQILHLGSPSPFRVVASDGAVISRTTAILAEAALREPESSHEDPSRLDYLAESAEFLLIESSGEVLPEASATLQLTESEGSYRIEGFGRLPLWRGPALVPSTPADVAAMQPWRVGGWPRVGVVTLPHLSNFSDFQILRGAEWIVVPPPGKLAVIFLPATADPAGDQSWLEAQGLAQWLDQQRQQGCRLVSIGWKFPSAEIIETGDLGDHVIASRLIGCRVDPPLPSGDLLERLGDWFGAWPRSKSLIDRLEARVVK